jgi:hypothetical protein
VYADGILLSNYLGNSATNAPRWGLVTPEEIERVDVMYGPFSAAYPGNSVGAVIDYVTRMPTSFEAHMKVSAFNQRFCFSQAQASQGADFFDHVDFVSTRIFQDDVKSCFFFNGSSSSSAAASHHRHGSSSRHAPFFFQHFHQIGDFQDRFLREFINQLFVRKRHCNPPKIFNFVSLGSLQAAFIIQKT